MNGPASASAHTGVAPVLPSGPNTSGGQLVLSRELVQLARHPGIVEVSGWEGSRPVCAPVDGIRVSAATLTSTELAFVLSRLAATADALHRRGICIGDLRADSVVLRDQLPIITWLDGLVVAGDQQAHHDVQALVRLGRSVTTTDDPSAALAQVLDRYALAGPRRFSRPASWSHRGARQLGGAQRERRTGTGPNRLGGVLTHRPARRLSRDLERLARPGALRWLRRGSSSATKRAGGPSPAVLGVAIAVLLATGTFVWSKMNRTVAHRPAQPGLRDAQTTRGLRTCATPLADPDGDGTSEAAVLEGNTIRVGRARFTVPSEGGRVVLGDWDGDGLSTPGVIRSDGRWRFDHWPGHGSQESAVADPLIDHRCTEQSSDPVASLTSPPPSRPPAEDTPK